MYSPTKKDIWFILIIGGMIAFLVLIYIFGGEPVGMQFITYKSVPGYIISALLLGLLLWIWFGTGYRVKDEIIQVSYGPFKTKIHIKEIRKIRRTKNPFTAPALAVNRLELLYGKYDVINISPKNESEFIHILLEINPQIVLEDNLIEYRGK